MQGPLTSLFAFLVLRVSLILRIKTCLIVSDVSDVQRASQVSFSELILSQSDGDFSKSDAYASLLRFSHLSRVFRVGAQFSSPRWPATVGCRGLRGGGGRRESDSQAFCRPNSVQALVHMEKHMGQVARQNPLPSPSLSSPSPPSLPHPPSPLSPTPHHHQTTTTTSTTIWAQGLHTSVWRPAEDTSGCRVRPRCWRCEAAQGSTAQAVLAP